MSENIKLDPNRDANDIAGLLAVEYQEALPFFTAHPEARPVFEDLTNFACGFHRGMDYKGIANEAALKATLAELSEMLFRLQETVPNVWLLITLEVRLFALTGRFPRESVRALAREGRA